MSKRKAKTKRWKKQWKRIRDSRRTWTYVEGEPIIIDLSGDPIPNEVIISSPLYRPAVYNLFTPEQWKDIQELRIPPRELPSLTFYSQEMYDQFNRAMEESFRQSREKGKKEE
jgi:hypothetical protein